MADHLCLYNFEGFYEGLAGWLVGWLVGGRGEGGLTCTSHC